MNDVPPSWQQAIAQLTAPGQPFELVELLVRGQPVRAFANAPHNLREVIEGARSTRPFLVYGDERLTYDEVWRRAALVARALVNDHGVGPGDRVAISMRNYPEWVIAFTAAIAVGAIAVPMNALWQAQDMAFALRDSGSKVLIADQERIDRLANCTIEHELGVIAVRSSARLPANARCFEDIVSAPGAAEIPMVEMAPDDDAIIIYTSGSTGNPKGVVSTHRNVVSALLSWELDAEARILTGTAKRPAPSEIQPAVLLAVPLFHVSGLHLNLLASYRAQRRLVAMYKWDADLAVDLIEREGVTGFGAPTAVTADLATAARRRGRRLDSLTIIGGGGAARAPGQVRTLAQTFPTAATSTGWGMTETNSIGTGVVGPEYLARPDSSGRVSAVLDIRVVDEESKALPAMMRGELQVRGASVMRGYWNNPTANDAVFVDGWMRTGDVAYIDADGFLYVVDRIKDLVIRGGENIGCGAVEAALHEHPAIIEASVYGVPDERLGEEVGATIFARTALDEATVRAFLQSRLAGFEIPRHIRFSAEPLARIASGKIAKRQLREEAIAYLAEAAVDATGQ